MASLSRYSVHPLVASDLDACRRLLCDSPCDSVPGSASVRADLAIRYLTDHVEADAAVAAVGPDRALVGYAAFDTFEFHGERAAFCPLAGHAALPSCAADAYEALYTALAERWVADGVSKHLVSIPVSQREVERRFFDLGFGRYVVDAYMPMDEHATRPVDPPAVCGGVTVRSATRGDASSLKSLLDESTGWYAASPIFLRTEQTSGEEVDELLGSDDAAVFLAEREGASIGFMGVRLVDGPNPVSLSAPGDATLEGIGAYLVPEARRGGVGEMLLARCRAWAASRGAVSLHVDYESANPAARSFWPKHFVPGVVSLMRHTHADVQEG